jgi:ketosteroid isomerase-like protein
MDPLDVAISLLEAFNAGDLDRMRELLAPHLVAWVTNAEGEVDRVTSRDEYLSRIAAMDLPGAQYRVALTQSPVAIDEHLVLIMVEVRAERDGRRLHNFAAHVLRVDDDRVTEWRMADAKPAESDQFWSS